MDSWGKRSTARDALWVRKIGSDIRQKGKERREDYVRQKTRWAKGEKQQKPFLQHKKKAGTSQVDSKKKKS